MQDLFLYLKSVILEINRLEEYYLTYQKNLPDRVGIFYENLREHEEIEAYLKEMDYSSYNELISQKLKEFVKKNFSNIGNLAQEIEYLKIFKNSLIELISKFTISKKDFLLILNKFNFEVKNLPEDIIRIYEVKNQELIYTNVLELKDFFNFYINLKYNSPEIKVIDVLNLYFRDKMGNLNRSLVKE